MTSPTSIFDALVAVRARLDQVRRCRSAYLAARDVGPREQARDALIMADEDLFKALDALDRMGGLAALIKVSRDEALAKERIMA